MPIANILVEIDAYLVRLRNARELLLAPVTELGSKNSQRGSKKIKTVTPLPFVVEKTQRPQSKSKARRSNAQLSMAFDESSVPHPDAPVQTAAELAPTLVAEPIPQEPTPAVVVKTVVPASGRKRTSIRPARPRPTPIAPSAKVDGAKPAIALAGPVHSKIVVVPAQQAKKEREQATHIEVKQPKISLSGLSGRRAFDALFKDEKKTSE